MSDTFYRRLTLIAGFFVLGAIFSMQTFVANVEIKDLDLWLHIGTGRYIVQHGFYIPSIDVLSCTIAGSPWVNHEWLFQVLVYWIYTVLGPNALIFMQVALTTATALILFVLGYNRKRQFLCLLSFLFVALIYQFRFTIRPDLFSLFFFILYILILSFFLDRKWSVPLLFIVQILWTNMHGFFFFGPLFVLIALGGEALKRHVPLPWKWNTSGRLSGGEYRRVKWLLGLSILACLFNPLTFKGAWYPIGVLLQISGDSSIFFEHIMELKKPLQMATLWSFNEYPYYKVLIVMSFVSFVFNRVKMNITNFFFWLVFLLFSMAAIRNMVYFAFAAHLAFMANISAIQLKDVVPIKVSDKKFIYLFSLVLKVFLLFWIMQYIINASSQGYFDFDRYQRKSEFLGISQRNFPNKAVDFLVENKVKGNMFNEFNSGAYVVGRCHPDIGVYIDGRTEVYGPDFFKHYLKIVREENLEIFKQDVHKYNISIVLINTVRDEGPKKILKYLYDSQDWKLVYLGYDGIIFLKDIPQHKETIKAHEIDLSQWKAEPLDEYRLGSWKVVPYPNLNKAFSLEFMGFPDQALDELKSALYIYPGYPEALALMGKIYADREEIPRAFHYFRLALTYKSGSRKIRTNLAKMYELSGQYDRAIGQYDKVIERFPTNPEAYFLAGRTYLKSGKFDQGKKYIQIAFGLNKNAAKDIIKLGDLLAENEKFAEAIEIYAIALDGNSRLREVRLKLGDAFEKMGEMGRAKKEWNMALDLAEDDEQKDEVMNRLKAKTDDL